MRNNLKSALVLGILLGLTLIISIGTVTVQAAPIATNDSATGNIRPDMPVGPRCNQIAGVNGIGPCNPINRFLWNQHGTQPWSIGRQVGSQPRRNASLQSASASEYLPARARAKQRLTKAGVNSGRTWSD